MNFDTAYCSHKREGVENGRKERERKKEKERDGFRGVGGNTVDLSRE